MSDPGSAPPAVAPVGPLRDVRGPSALGGGARRFFDLLWLISVTEFKRTYFGTVLGYVWSLLRPLLLFGVLLFVFTRVFKIGSEEVVHYPVMLLMGIVLFTFFQESNTNAVSSVVTQEGIVRKTQFPRLVIPLATVLTASFNLCLNLVIVFVFLFAFGVDPTWTWLLFPFALVALFALTAALSMALSVLYVRFRDVSIIWLVFAQALFYVTPILYPVTAFKNARYEHLLMINPLAVIFTQVRVWILAERHVSVTNTSSGPKVVQPAPTAVEAAGGALHLLPALAIFLAICVFGVWIFNRDAPRIAEDL
ncbi:MAG: ABC transporter permease [Solirubrobacterales bacterium]|nr:ABC transporter permease [Solirubrobacterales bacterium]